MKTFVAGVALAGMAGSAMAQISGCILNTVMNPNQQQVEDSINQWNSDVLTVNNFLNTADVNDATTLLSQAQTALTSATDEPCQLMTLSSISDFDTPTAAFGCAVQDLNDVFMVHVIDNLNIIIDDPTNTTAVNLAIGDINIFRCNNVLPDVDILWSDSAEDNGIANQVNTIAQRENACSTIITNPPCNKLDNGGFGVIN